MATQPVDDITNSPLITNCAVAPCRWSCKAQHVWLFYISFWYLRIFEILFSCQFRGRCMKLSDSDLELSLTIESYLSYFSLIVACRYRPTPIVTHLLEYLAPSRSLVVYSSASEVGVCLRFLCCLRFVGYVIDMLSSASCKTLARTKKMM